MTSNSKRPAELSLGVSQQELEQATRNHRLKTEILVAKDIPEVVVQSTLDDVEATYQVLANTYNVELDDYKFYYACIVANAVAIEQESGRHEHSRQLVDRGLQKLIKNHGTSIHTAHGVLSIAFHARDNHDTHNIAQHLIYAVRDKDCPSPLRKRLAEMGYSTPPHAGLDGQGKPYYRWKGKNGIASSFGVRRSPKKP